MGRKKKNNKEVLVIDVESTCWEGNPPAGQQSEIIEIGLSLVDRGDLLVRKMGSIIVKPQISSVSPFCTKLTTLTQADVDKGISFKEACSRIQKKYGDIAWASWGDYDRVQFERVCKALKVKYPFGRRHLNIKELFAQVYDIKKGPGMDRALEMMNLELVGTHHRGDDDAYNIARILAKMYETFRGLA